MRKFLQVFYVALAASALALFALADPVTKVEVKVTPAPANVQTRPTSPSAESADSAAPQLVSTVAQASAPSSVPEPASMMLFGTGLIGVAMVARRAWR